MLPPGYMDVTGADPSQCCTDGVRLGQKDPSRSPLDPPQDGDGFAGAL